VLLTGQSSHSVDGKQRLSIPAKYRSLSKKEGGSAAWYCVPWPDGSLRLYLENDFKAMALQEDQRLTPASDEAERQRRFFGLAERLEVDPQGRVTIPRTHLELTGLGAEVVIVGAMNRLEVRDRAKWEAELRATFENLPEIVERVESKRPRA
jgi:MraZ protein